VLNDPVNFVDQKGTSSLGAIAGTVGAVYGVYLAYTAIDSFLDAREQSEATKEKGNDYLRELDNLQRGEESNAEDAETLYRDAVKDLARAAARFGADSKRLELNFGNRLPKVTGMSCP